MSATLFAIAQNTISPLAVFQVTDKENEVYCAIMTRDDFLDFFGYDETDDREDLISFIDHCARLNDMGVGETHWDAFGNWIVHRLADRAEE